MFQELGQADISLVEKMRMRDRLAALRKSFDKEIKEKELTATKAVCPHRRFCILTGSNPTDS